MICEILTHAELTNKCSSHIVKLEAIYFHHDKKKNLLESSILTEYMKNGDLNDYIKNDSNYKKLSFKDKVGFAI
jgi:serine/threonine protein kinase